MAISGFVITLERAVSRRPHVEWIRTNTPFECVELSAVDGSKMTDDEVAAIYERQIYSPRYPHVLKRGEIGCFLSHRKAWQKIVEQKLAAAVILEDDVTFDSEALASTIAFAEANIQPRDYVQFQVREIGNAHRVVAQDQSHSIVQPCPAFLRTTAQIVTYEAAVRLLEVTQRIDRPVDAFLQMTWDTKVPVKVLLPRVITEISQSIGGSTLGWRRKPWLEKLSVDIMRPIYRAQIRYRSARAS